MSRLLEKAMEKIRSLPDAEQDAVAALILERFSDGRQWDEAFRPLRGRPFRPDPPKPLEMTEGENWEATPENAERISRHINALIEAGGCVLEARRIVSKIRPGVSEKLDYWKKVLAEPVARLSGPGSGGDMRKDMMWLENNADNYKGKWVALRDGVLLGSHESRAELRQILRQSGKLEKSFFVRM
ncbi:hypothetical protein QUF72_02590 [Desulfobacterales bacterium HSG2]|nr:hypothetical protein [Desulfobacterales bacterium HSG2]